MSDRVDPPVLVLGASSLVGRFLLPRLAEAGVETVAVSREPAVAAMNGVRWLQADIASAGWADAAPACSTVFALTPLWLVPQALPPLLARGAKRLVAFSSTSVFTKAASPVPAEREVARKLAAAEAAIAALAGESGLAWTILRPTMIYAEGLDGNVTRLARLIARLGVLPLSGAGEGLRQPVHADDLAAAALTVAATPATHDKAYDLPGGETLSYRDLVRRLFEAQGRKPRILHVPPALWRLGLGLASPLLPGATAAMGDRMAENLTFDAGPAQRDFGWAPRAFRPRFPAGS